MGVAGPTGTDPKAFGPSENVTEPVICGRGDAPAGMKTERGVVNVMEFPAKEGLKEVFKAPSDTESLRTGTMAADVVELPL